MALICASAATSRFASIRLSASSSSTKIDRKLWAFSSTRAGAGFKAQAFFNPFESKPVVKEALEEPVAFLGGMFAGLLRLDLNEDPLKEWIERTVKSAGLDPEEVVESKLDGDEDLPQLIEIE